MGMGSRIASFAGGCPFLGVSFIGGSTVVVLLLLADIIGTLCGNFFLMIITHTHISAYLLLERVCSTNYWLSRDKPPIQSIGTN